MKHVRFRKLYHRHQEGEVVDIALISYDKHPITLDNNIPISWKHWLHVDLWILTFYITWETRIAYKIDKPKTYERE